jgi:hypothetical protein
LQEEAAELAKLSAGIPAGIERVNQGQLPKTRRAVEADQKAGQALAL